MMKILDRIWQLVTRGIVTNVHDQNRQSMDVQIGPNDSRQEVERVQDYGFSSVPLPGAEAVVAHPGGNRSHPLVLAADDPRYRPAGVSGDSCLYHFEGGKVLLTVAGLIQIVTQQQSLTFSPTTGTTTLTDGANTVAMTPLGTTLSYGPSSISLTATGIILKAPRIDLIQ